MLSLVRLLLGAAALALSYTWPLHVLGPYADTCNNGDDSPYLLSIVAGPATLLLAGAGIWIGAPDRRILRWFAAPWILLLSFALWYLAPYLAEVTVGGRHVCAGNWMGGPAFDPAEPWHRLYAPAHLLSVALFLASVWRFARFALRL